MTTHKEREPVQQKTGPGAGSWNDVLVLPVHRYNEAKTFNEKFATSIQETRILKRSSMRFCAHEIPDLSVHFLIPSTFLG
jgi:hypothetical protein